MRDTTLFCSPGRSCSFFDNFFLPDIPNKPGSHIPAPQYICSLFQMRARDLWKEMVDIEHAKDDVPASQLAKALGSLRAVDDTPRRIFKRQAGGMECKISSFICLYVVMMRSL